MIGFASGIFGLVGGLVVGYLWGFGQGHREATLRADDLWATREQLRRSFDGTRDAIDRMPS